MLNPLLRIKYSVVLPTIHVKHIGSYKLKLLQNVLSCTVCTKVLHHTQHGYELITLQVG